MKRYELLTNGTDLIRVLEIQDDKAFVIDPTLFKSSITVPDIMQSMASHAR